MFGSSAIGILLLITHILASFTVGFIFRFWKNNNFRYSEVKTVANNNISFLNFGESISNSISSSISTISMIGGFVVLFSVIISILKNSKLLNLIGFIFKPIFCILHIPSNFVLPFIIGIFEITNGILLISAIKIKAISINIILASFLLGIGGISVFLQVLSIISKTDLSVKPYIIGKILQGFISAFYTYALIHFFPFFNFNL